MTANTNRWRCLTVGCNPKLYGQPAAHEHRDVTGHRVAKWPVRSEEGKRRARIRNKTGYYDKYNTGHKDPRIRLGRPSLDDQIGGLRFRPSAVALSAADMADNGYGDEDAWGEDDMGFDCDIGF